MYKVGIIGIGFLGGSLARSLSKSSKVESIIAFDTNTESLIKAQSEGVINKYTTEVNEEFKDCNIIFICTPVSFITEYAKILEGIVREDCVITDIGSTKKTIIEGVKNLDINFVGGHPMIGSERSGFETSKEILFENSYYIIVKSKKSNESSLEILKELVLELKAIPIVINEDEHDYITAVISHVPHIVAYSLVNLLKQSDDVNETMKTLAAGGFKDITRIASSDPTMWENICHENKEQILKVMDDLLDIFEKVKKQIKDGERDDIYNFFEESKNFRDSFVNRKINGNTMPELDVSIKDENGAIAKVTTILSNNNIGIKNIEVVNNRENNYGALKIIFPSYFKRDEALNILKDNGFEVKIIE